MGYTENKTLVLLTFLLITFLLLMADSAEAQKRYEKEAEICVLKFIFEDQEQYISYEPNDSLMVVDFFKGLEDKQMEKLRGAILLQVIIDTTDQICCLSYTNKTRISDKKLDIPTRLKAMPGWKRIAPGLENENICALIHIYIDKYDYKVQHLGYNRNTGKHLIKSFIYRQHAKDTAVVIPK